MRVKICGITQAEQASAIAQLGATALGFICVPASPRYIAPAQIQAIVDHLKVRSHTGQLVDRIGVFVNAAMEDIVQIATTTGLNGVQLHGTESPQFCDQLRQALPKVEILKALRIQDSETLEQTRCYAGWVDTLLLDAYHPQLAGGTGKTLDWQALKHFHPACPWFLAGGLNPDNVLNALSQVNPAGIDLSSGVEQAPGDKDLAKVSSLFRQLSVRL